MPDSEMQHFLGRNSQIPEEFDIIRAAPVKEYEDLLFVCANISGSAAAALIITGPNETWQKAIYNNSGEELSLQDSVLEFATEQSANLIVPALQQESRINLSGNRNYNFLAVLPLFLGSGEKLGFIILLDAEEKKLKQGQEDSLNILKEQILNLVSYRKQNSQFRRVRRNLEQKYHDLEKFASVVSHDIKSPLANIISLTGLLKEENEHNFNEETRQYINFLSQASHTLRTYVDGLLIFYRSDKILEKEEEDVDLAQFFEKFINLYDVGQDVEIKFPQHGKLHQVNKAALTQIFMNLISNGLKYNDKPVRKVEIIFHPLPEYYEFEVRDNGNGIPRESFDRIFELFATLDQNDREGNPGSGIGLATVQKLLHHMGGDIRIESEPGRGSNFIFKIKRSD